MHTSDDHKYKGTIYDEFDEDYEDDPIDKKSKEKKSSKKSNDGGNKKVIIIIILGAVLLVLFGVFLYINYFDKDKKPPEPVEDVLVIDQNSLNLNLEVGKTHQISYQASKNYKNITFFSSNEKVCTVTSSGLVKAVKTGNAEITLSYSYNGTMDSQTITVIVSPKASDTFTITSGSSISLTIGKTAQIKYKSTVDHTDITYSSSNTNIITVSDTGLIKGIKAGSAKITVSYKFRGEAKAKTVNVTVKTQETPTPTPEPTKKDLEIKISASGGASTSSFSNKNVTVQITGTGDGAVQITYTLNCLPYMDEKDCTKKTATNSATLTISDNGTTVIDVTATDNSGKKVTKQQMIYIDKTKPTCALSIKADTGVVTAATSDSWGDVDKTKGKFTAPSTVSGTTMTLTATSSSTIDVTYQVFDKAGNSNTCSKSFKSTCSSGKCTWS